MDLELHFLMVLPLRKTQTFFVTQSYFHFSNKLKHTINSVCDTLISEAIQNRQMCILLLLVCRVLDDRLLPINDVLL